jgi:hypothetical protein
LLSSSFMITPSTAQNYAKIMHKAVKKVLDEDINGFEKRSYPVDNFGLITAYSASDSVFICDMFNCLGMDDIQSSSANWLAMNGYAGIGSGGGVQLSESKSTSVAFSALLPQFASQMGLSAGLMTKRNTTVKVSFGAAHFRKLRQQNFMNYIRTLDNTSELKQAYNNNNLLLTIEDCVIDNLSVSITVSSNTSVSIDATMDPGSNTKIFDGGDLGLKVEKTGEATYTLTAIHPVIFAYKIKKRPSSGGLSTSDDFSDWIDATFDIENN